jgi:Na+-translocating ferredoxin:NAD+ oxidoreductase RNF subunit RnfB
MGVIFGGVLAYASHKFAVEADPRVAAIRDALPGANCGGCGFPGCDGMASAIAEGTAAPNGCPVASSEANHKIADILGIAPVESEKMVARIVCAGGTDKCTAKFEYYGLQNCKAANMIKGGNKNCKFGCLGYGSCAAVCPFDAIQITENNIAKVDYTKCTGCGKCIEECPKKVITLTPFENRVHVDCNNKEMKKTLSVRCSAGFIACKQCSKVCPHDAIVMENNLARINYEKCQECMLCVEKCPTKAISGELEKREQKEICIQPPKGGCSGCAHGSTCANVSM